MIDLLNSHLISFHAAALIRLLFHNLRILFIWLKTIFFNFPNGKRENYSFNLLIKKNLEEDWMR